MSSSNSSDAIQRFTLWSIRQLKLRLSVDQAGVYEVEIPAQHQGSFGELASIRFTFVQTASPADGVELVQPGSRLLEWLIEQGSDSSQIAHATPAGANETAAQLAARLFPAYSIDKGSVRLSGCTLELRAISWLIARRPAADGRTEEFYQVYLDPNGQSIDDETVRKLGADDVVALDKPPKLTAAEAGRLGQVVTELVRTANQERALTRDSVVAAPDAELLAMVVIWCRFAEGKLRFDSGSSTAELAFAGWARMLEPPPFTCPHSKIASFHLACTDDGRIAAAEGIGQCTVTGCRTLLSELVPCTTSGELVMRELAATCPVTGEVLTEDQLASCPTCYLPVTPRIIGKDRCKYCPPPAAVKTTDPRMAQLCSEYPGLDDWRSWQISENAVVYMLIATSLLKRLLVVVEKDSMQVLRVATRSRFSSDWIDAAQSEYAEYLK